MEETPNANAVLNGLSPEARRNLVETAALTPRDKENAVRANSTQHAQSAAVDQPKASISTTTSATTTSAAAPPARTPARSRLVANPTPHQRSSPSFFSFATTPSPVSGNAAKSLPASASSSNPAKAQPTTPAPPAFPSLIAAQKSPPGTSQVLRKHFQSLGFATPGKHALQQQQQQRILSSGAVRLTPNSRKKAHKGNHQSMACRRIGVDGTKHTPSKELLKSTTSSRNQRVLAAQDHSMEQYPTTLDETQPEDLQQLNQIQPGLEFMDDETSDVASAATDDASFDMSLPSMNNQNFYLSSNNNNNASHVIPAPLSPLTPRMGCLNPVALTLLNDGKEDYNYLLTQDALYPIPKVEDATEQSAQPANTSMSSSSSTSSSCLSPTPAEVRATLSHTVRSTLARPVAIMAKTGRISPSQPRLLMRPQPKQVR